METTKNTRSIFEYFEKPRPYPITKFGKNGISPFFVILSTKYLHPDFYMVGIDGEFEMGKKSPIIKLRLFPSRVKQQCEQVGTILVNGLIDPVLDYPPLLSFEYACCPTMIILFLKQKMSDKVKLFAPFLKNFHDAKNTLQLFKKHRKDPLQRIRRDWGFMITENQDIEKVTDLEAEELAKIVLKPNSTEIPAFFLTWEATLNYLKMGPQKINTVSMEEFLTWFNSIFGTD